MSSDAAKRAEARRAKILARGAERLQRITGNMSTISDQVSNEVEEHLSGIVGNNSTPPSVPTTIAHENKEDSTLRHRHAAHSGNVTETREPSLQKEEVPEEHHIRPTSTQPFIAPPDDALDAKIAETLRESDSTLDPSSSPQKPRGTVLQWIHFITLVLAAIYALSHLSISVERTEYDQDEPTMSHVVHLLDNMVTIQTTKINTPTLICFGFTPLHLFFATETLFLSIYFLSGSDISSAQQPNILALTKVPFLTSLLRYKFYVKTLISDFALWITLMGLCVGVSELVNDYVIE